MEEYFFEKIIDATLFTDNTNQLFANKVIRELVAKDNFLDMLIGYYEEVIVDEIFDNRMKRNMLDTISYLRFNQPYSNIAEKEKIYEKCNNIILKINNADVSDFNWDKYIIDENRRRFGLPKKEEILALVNYDRLENLFASIAFDIEVLVILDSSEEEFINTGIKKVLCNSYFFASLNAIMDDIPELLHNKQFLDRIQLVLSYNKLLLKKKKCEYNVEIKSEEVSKIKKRTKEYSKKIISL